MINSKDVLWVNSTNLKVDGAAITKGECRCAEGKAFDFTESLMTKILSNFNDAIPFKIGHGNTPEVGRAYKLGFDPVTTELQFEGHVYGDDKRKVIESCGYNKISPEIDFTFDANGDPIDGVITALAFVTVPAMEGTQASCQRMTFSAPSATDKEKDTMKDGTTIFFPKGTIVISEPTVDAVVPEVKPEGVITPTSNFEADVEKYKQMSAKFEAEVVTAKAESSILEANVTDLKVQVEDYKGKVTSLEAENNAFIQEKTDVLAAELKTMGFKSPETIAMNLPPKQRIEVLKQMKSNFITASPADVPTKSVEVPKGEPTVREKAIAAIPEELRKYINSGV